MSAFASPIQVQGSPQRPQRPQRPQLHRGQNDVNHINQEDRLRRRLFSPDRPEATPESSQDHQGHARGGVPPRQPYFSSCD